MSLIHEDKIRSNKAEFISKLMLYCKALGIDPNWLMQVMYNESGLDPQARNPYTNAVGLIQFMPDTAAYLGTSIPELLKMSNVQQLDYVYKYLKTYSGKLKSYIDTYFAVFFPAAINKPIDWVFQTSKLSASLIARQNPVFDLNKDQVLTVREVQEAMLRNIPAQFRELFKKKT